MANGNGRKEYNLTVAPMWKGRDSENVRSMVLDEEMIEAIGHIEKGGMLLIKFIPDGRRKTEKSPHAYLEYIKPADVEAFFGNTGKGRPAQKQARVTVASTDDQDDVI